MKLAQGRKLTDKEKEGKKREEKSDNKKKKKEERMYKKGIIKEIKKPAHTCEGKENSTQNFRRGGGERNQTLIKHTSLSIFLTGMLSFMLSDNKLYIYTVY